MAKISLNIGGIPISLEPGPILPPPPFGDFLSSGGEAPELSWAVKTGGSRETGKKRLNTSHTVLLEQEGRFCVSFPPFPLIRGLVLEGDRAELDLDGKELLTACPGHVAEAVSYGLEVAFFYAAQKRGFLAAHSASLIYRDKAYLFLASSGTGKTTHVKLWQERFGEGVQVLDGDVALCGTHEGTPCAWGLPWCGTSGEYQNRRAELGGFVFLQRSKENRAARLSPLDGTLRLAARCFTPTWTKEMTAANFDVAERLAKKVPCYLLECLPDQDAVDAVLAQL